MSASSLPLPFGFVLHGSDKQSFIFASSMNKYYFNKVRNSLAILNMDKIHKIVLCCVICVGLQAVCDFPCQIPQ